MAAPKTLTYEENPLSARARFRYRVLYNWLWACFLFAVWALLVAPFSLRWIADAAGIAVLFYIVFFVWDKRAIKICCTSCPEILLTNTPWVCGFCGCKNENVHDFSFVHECATCHGEPKAYKCHHCGELIFLTEDHVGTNYAFCLNAPVATKEDEIDLRKREADLKQQELIIADLDEKLDQINRRRGLAKKTQRTK